jgi:hypothetical protein
MSEVWPRRAGEFGVWNGLPAPSSGLKLEQQTGAQNRKSNWPWWIRTTINGSKVHPEPPAVVVSSRIISHFARGIPHRKRINAEVPRTELSKELSKLPQESRTPGTGRALWCRAEPRDPLNLKVVPHRHCEVVIAEPFTHREVAEAVSVGLHNILDVGREQEDRKARGAACP